MKWNVIFVGVNSCRNGLALMKPLNTSTQTTDTFLSY
jgi:hypothetical protein